MLSPNANLAIIGYVFGMSGIVILLLIWIPILMDAMCRTAWGVTWWKRYRIWREWYCYRPLIEIQPELSISSTAYTERGGNVTVCEVFLDITITNRYPLGELRVDFSKARLALLQHHGLARYEFHLSPKADTGEFATSNIGIPFQRQINFMAAHLPQAGKYGSQFESDVEMDSQRITSQFNWSAFNKTKHA